jgi:hypothetical protein
MLGHVGVGRELDGIWRCKSLDGGMKDLRRGLFLERWIRRYKLDVSGGG